MTRKLTNEELKLWQKAVREGFRNQESGFVEKKSPTPESRILSPKRVEARLDLHGLTIEKAHTKFIEFVYNSSVEGLSKILVITGKGKDGKGLIRQELPMWCEAEYLSPFIKNIKVADIKHGGGGAFYINLRSG